MSTMQQFQYKGMNKRGDRVNGVVQAIDQRAAEAEIKGMDIELISISKHSGSSFTFTRKKKIKAKEIVLFTRYLATMLSAGMPILKVLDIIGRDQENPALRSVISTIRASISSGSTLADSLEQFPEYFGELYTNLTRAGEKSATLDNVLARLVKYLEKIEKIKSKVKHALIYPITIVVIAVGVSLVLLLFVIPQFETMFKNAGAQLPAFTMIVIQLSNLLGKFWWMLIIMCVFAYVGFVGLMKKSAKFADLFDAALLRIYIIGPIIKKSIIARFTRTLAITLDAGMPIVDSMRSMVTIMGNRSYGKAVNKICDDIVSGHQLSTSIEASGLFPNMVTQMIAVGEESGALGEMLNNIADYYEEEVDNIADNLSTLLEPIIIVLLGIIIGAFIIAMYLPIFKLGSAI